MTDGREDGREEVEKTYCQGREAGGVGGGEEGSGRDSEGGERDTEEVREARGWRRRNHVRTGEVKEVYLRHYAALTRSLMTQRNE